MNKKNKNRIYAFLIAFGTLIGIAPSSAATNSKSLSLAEAKQFAIENNLTIKNAVLDQEIAKRKVTETTAIGLPQVSGSVSYQHLFSVPEFSVPTTGYSQNPLTFAGGTAPEGFSQFSSVGGLNQYLYAGKGLPISVADNAVFKVQVSQLIFSGEYIVGLQATRVFKLMSEQSLTKSKIELSASVENTYNMILILNENLNIVAQNKAIVTQTLNEMKAMEKAGFLQSTDVEQLQVNLSVISNLEQSLQGQTKNLNNLLKYQLGMKMDEELTLTDNIESVIASVSPLNISELNVNQNIDYQIINNSIATQKLMLKREQAAYLPSIAAFYQHQEKAKTPAFDFEPKDLLGVTLNVPILSSGSRLMKVKQAKFAVEKAINSQEQFEKGLALQYENQRLSYQTAYNTFLTQQESSKTSKSIFDKTTLKYKEGLASSTELSQAQGQYLTSVSNYYNALLTLLNARVELQKISATN